VSERIGLGRSSRRGCGVSKQTQRPADHASRTRETPDGRRRAAKAGWPLARETSAGGARRVGWSLGSLRRPRRRVARLEAWEVSGDATRIRWSAWRMGSNPFGGFPPSPAQAGRAVSTSLKRGSVDPSVVLVDCFWLQKSTRGTWSKSAPTTGNRRGKRWV